MYLSERLNLILLLQGSIYLSTHAKLWHTHIPVWSQAWLLQLDAAQQPLKIIISHTSSPQSLYGIMKHWGKLPCGKLSFGDR